MPAVGSEVEVTLGPWSHVYDSGDPGGATPESLVDAFNMVDLDHFRGSAQVARHGIVGLTTQLGASDAARTGQGIFFHRRRDGRIDRFTFGGGKMYSWDGLNTFTDITPVGIEISSTNPIFCASFSGEVLVSDEKNKPWVYTPETGAAATLQFNAANDEWTTKGGAGVFSGYNVFIVRAVGTALLQAETGDYLTTEDGSRLLTELLSGEQNTIAWGEPFDPRLGYDQANYDHTWELTQTSNELLGGLFAEEGGLVYLRNTGIGILTGAVDDNWRNSATRDAISNTIGTDAPAAIVSANKRVFFLDMDGRPYMMVVGGGEPTPLWLPLRREVQSNFGSASNRANVVSYGRAAHHPEYDIVLFTIWDRTTLYGFDAQTGQYIGQWEVLGGVHVDAMGALLDDNSRMTFCLLGTRGTSYTESAKGVFWRQKHSSDTSQWLDQADASVGTHTSFTRRVETHYAAHQAARQLRVVRLQYKRPGATYSTALSAQSTATTGGFDDTDAIALARWSPGRNAQGSSLRLRVSATHSDNVRFGIHRLTMHGRITELRPK